MVERKMSDINDTSNHKKSETIEVRVSFESKQALQAKAKREGRTLSGVIRDLISDYLANPSPKDEMKQGTFFIQLKEKMMLLNSIHITKTALGSGAIGGALIVMSAFLPNAAAEDVRLVMHGESVQQCDNLSKNGQNSFKAEFGLNFGDTGSLIVDNDDDTNISPHAFRNQPESYFIKVSLNQVGDDIALSLNLFNGRDESGKNIANPSMLMGFDQESIISISTDEKGCYRLKFLARNVGNNYESAEKLSE